MSILKKLRNCSPAAAIVFLVTTLVPASGIAGDGVYAPYSELLERYLVERDLPDDGLVTAFDYRGALADDVSGLLARQREALAGFDTDTLDTREQAIAFWLNAYNYFMIEYILENPHRGELIGSVRDYGSLFNPYRVFRREVFDIGGRKYSLSGIENDILLGDDFRERGWKEARVHFAVNCASVGCPPLRAVPYTADNVDTLLTENTRRAFNTPLHLRVDGDTLHLTRLFDWYEDHFVNEAGSVREFIREYADNTVREAIADTRRIRFIDYDWDLNEPDNFAAFD